MWLPLTWLSVCAQTRDADMTNGSRRLLGSEARKLCRDMPNCFCEGETLANLALKWDNMAVLTFVLEAAEAQPAAAQRDENVGGASVREGKEEAGVAAACNPNQR